MQNVRQSDFESQSNDNQHKMWMEEFVNQKLRESGIVSKRTLAELKKYVQCGFKAFTTVQQLAAEGKSGISTPTDRDMIQ